MMTEQPMPLTLEELSNEVASHLEQHGLLGAQQDHRVSSVPDARTIRYYTTLGLLDRPRMDGRQARYGRRHVLQLLAVKALQGASMPLSEIQSRLYGRSDAELTALLASLSEERVVRKEEESVRPLIWRELVIEPGLRLMVEEGWTLKADRSTLEERIRAVLSAL
jgi:DNA-binding transcriptional MerR regulator